MADPARPLTLSDLWLRGDVLDGALLRGWNGPVFWFMHTDGDSADTLPSFERIDGIHVQELEPDEAGGRHLSFIPHEWFGRHVSSPPGLDFTRPEVRDRAVRVLGPDLLPIHAAELRGEITPAEAAGLVWCSVLRREAGLSPLQGWHGEWRRCGPAGVPVRHERWERGRSRRDLAPPMVTGTARQVLTYRELSDSDALAAGYALREPGGILLLPLPDGVVGRLECSNG